MNKSLRAILAITLSAILAVGMAVSGCSGGSGPDFAGLGIITSASAGSASDIKLGEPAPNFWFTDAQGLPTSLSDLKGKLVLVNFWATWCSPCRSEMPYIQQIYQDWSEDELVVLAVNVGESADDVTDFLEDNGFSFPVLLDSEGEAYLRYGALGLPTTLFIDKEGLLQDGRVGAFQSAAQIESILNQLD